MEMNLLQLGNDGIFTRFKCRRYLINYFKLEVATIGGFFNFKELSNIRSTANANIGADVTPIIKLSRYFKLMINLFTKSSSLTSTPTTGTVL